MKKVAVFPGTFDPFTIGHEDIVKRALSVFDEVIVAIGVNALKKNCFSVKDRIDMMTETEVLNIEQDKDGHWRRTLEHLHEKYAEGGYLKLWMEDSPNAAPLAELRRLIGDEERLRTLFERYFQNSLTTATTSSTAL